jgi:hypothetical protein
VGVPLLRRWKRRSLRRLERRWEGREGGRRGRGRVPPKLRAAGGRHGALAEPYPARVRGVREGLGGGLLPTVGGDCRGDEEEDRVGGHAGGRKGKKG